MEYNFKEIEESWKNFYQENKTFFRNTNQLSSKKKFYCLEMFPYPSGDLHMGHARNYTIGDVIARYRKLKGYDVLHPIGWDAFGLPAENAAIEKKIHPKNWTFSNINRMRKQLQELGLSYDWDNEICTAKEDYYRWGQWLFIKFYEKGLIYRKNASVYWDPIDKTVLAKEQVQDGKAWRSGAVVVKKVIEQWYIRITNYAEELLNDLDKLEGWPEKVKIMQRNWIGKSEGVIINFKFQNRNFPIFTTRPDTVFGVRFMGIAFDHKNLFDYVKKDKNLINKIQMFVDQCREIDQNSDYQKEGIYTGSQITHPLTGIELPLYVTNFVLAEYGTGAIMGVPAHDQRDFEFAKKYHLPITQVIVSPLKKSGIPLNAAYTKSGIMVNSEQFNGMPNDKTISKIITYLEEKKVGERKTQYKLKDWLISRQRYWGNPIPMLKNSSGEYIPEKEENLPVTLPDLPFTNTGNPLVNHTPFIETIKDGEIWKRETDTMDTFTCSSWYYLRYVDPINSLYPFDKKIAQHWLPVDQYIGGIEHACMHLLYARFFHKALRDMGLVESDEPFKNLLTQGMVVSPSYFSPSIKKYFSPHELKGDKKTCPITGNHLVIKMEKMSKSKHNGVDPEEMISRYGSDSIRLFVLFAAPPEKVLEWNEGGIEGCQRFLLKVYRWANLILSTYPMPEDDNTTPSKSETILSKSLDRTIAKVGDDIEKFHFNTAIATMMTFINQASTYNCNDLKYIKNWQEHTDALKKFLIILSPFAPFLAEELYHELRKKSHNDKIEKTSISKENWPYFNPQSLIKDKVMIAIQVNGKMRRKIEVPANTPQPKILSLVRQEPNIINHLKGKKLIREIVIPNRLVNFVVK